MLKKEVGKWIRNLLGEAKPGKMIEKRSIQREIDFEKPPIFIVGLPRTGSTLLYQLVCNNFELSFFTNLANVFYAYPATITYLIKPFLNDQSIEEYESNYGVSEGLIAPSEGGGIYRYWFENAEVNDELIIQTMGAIASTLKKPFIWKNLNLSYEIPKLNKLFPNALFIKMNRALPYVIQSIFLKTINGKGIGIDGLTKRELSKYPDLLKSLTEKVLQKDRIICGHLEQSDVLSLNAKYESLCNDPLSVMDKIRAKYANTGYELPQKSNCRDKPFPLSDEIKMETEQWSRIQNLIDEAKV